MVAVSSFSNSVTHTRSHHTLGIYMSLALSYDFCILAQISSFRLYLLLRTQKHIRRSRPFPRAGG